MNTSKHSIRLRGGIFIALTLGALLLCATAAQAAFSPYYTRCTTDKLRVRESASLSGAIQDHLADRQLVWVVEEKKADGVLFYRVDYINAKGVRENGWVVYQDGKTYYLKDLTSSEVSKLSYKKGELPGQKSVSSGSSGSSGSSSSGGGGNYGYLRLGSKGEAVRKLQQSLKDLRMYSGDVTGTFGTRTEEAVRAFQKKKGLYADGIAGPSTQAALYDGGSGSGTAGGSSSSSGTSSNSSANAGRHGLTTADKVMLRVSPSTSAKDRAMLRTGAVFTVLSTTRVGGYDWYYVSVPGGKGYLRSDLVRLMSAAEESEYNNSGQAPGAGDSSGGSSGGDNGGSSSASGMARITASNVNVRAEASSSSGLVGRLNKDAVLTISATQKAGGVTWYRLSQGSLTGWVHGDYVHVMTQAEIDAYEEQQSGGSSSGGGASTSYRLLKVGSTGADVRRLQQALKDMGLYSGEVTGSFGTKTEAAVKAYQKKVGLYVDGVAGPKTQAMLYEGSSSGGSSGGGSTVAPNVKGVEVIRWEEFKSLYNNKNFTSAVLTDVATGKSFNLVKQSLGSHLDAEPATQADTNVLKQIYGVSSVSSITYVRRAVWLTIGDRTFAGSIYGVPHGDDTISDNGYSGQFCVHLLGSKTHTGNQVDPDHQKMMWQAYDKAAVKVPLPSGVTHP
ncbi:MAG: peptidoglycan-binding protein [Oscillospiraceae bacterium]|jgi:peptidoglycan hydrolase-like protein with peptidoglycan-binding domain|nr:peptidoglycan-binding protein [Oscillospiraceae bacterium]